MDLSPLNQLVGMFDGAESLGGFGPDSYQGPGRRARGSARLFAEFYISKTAEQVCSKVKETPLAHGVVRQEPKEWKIVPLERLFVRVIDPGDKYNTFDGVATDEHKREFYPEYEAFMAGRTKPVGRALTEAPFIDEGIKLELNRIKIFTLEQLRDASDSAMALLGADNFHLREQAGQWLDASETNEEKQRIVELERKVKELMAKGTSTEDSKPRRKRGPNKVKKNEEVTTITA